MDLATILGATSGFGLVIVAMSMGGGLSWFINIPSLMIVLGGTIGALLINYPLSEVFGVIKISKNVILSRNSSVDEVIERLVEMSQISRREGILALERSISDAKDVFFVKGVSLMIDGIEPEILSKILNTEMEFLAERHRLGAEIFSTMGNFAPAMGMMGTLIGLVKMLMMMDNPSTIGPAMAVALITTFYGVILANLVFIPIAGKLKTKSSQELLVKQLMISGILSVQSGDNPRVLEQKLHSFIAPEDRRSMF